MKRGILLGLIVGVIAASAWPALAAWLVTSRGEAGVQLASLAPLKVGTAHATDDPALPGKTLPLVADVDNPNPISLAIVDVQLDALTSGDAGCDVSDVTFKSTDVTVDSGSTKDVQLGKLTLPGKLANACQGKTITAQVTARAAYGS